MRMLAPPASPLRQGAPPPQLSTAGQNPQVAQFQQMFAVWPWPRLVALRWTNWTLVVAPRPAAWCTRLLLGLDCGEQPLYGALRRRTERFVQMNRLCKLLADEVIALREFGVAGKCSLDEIGLAAA
jgi:hypothetical protein